MLDDERGRVDRAAVRGLRSASCRVVSDAHTVAYPADVYVLAEHRGRRSGSRSCASRSTRGRPPPVWK